jgi:hypothetical protein
MTIADIQREAGLRLAIEAAGTRYRLAIIQREAGLQLAIEAAGTRYRLAMLLGIRPASVLKWWRVPSDRIVQVERVTGIPREKLRPDLYRSISTPVS